MSQTCNIFCQKVSGLTISHSLQRAFGYCLAYTNIATVQSSDSRRLLDGVRLQTSVSV